MLAVAVPAQNIATISSSGLCLDTEPPLLHIVGLLFLWRDLFAIPALGSDHAHAGILLSPDDRGRAGRAPPADRGERLGFRRPRRVGIPVPRERPLLAPSSRHHLDDQRIELCRPDDALFRATFEGAAVLRAQARPSPRR